MKHETWVKLVNVEFLARHSAEESRHKKLAKAGLKMRGRDVGIPRKPILPLSNTENNDLKNIMKNAKIID